MNNVWTPPNLWYTYRYDDMGRYTGRMIDQGEDFVLLEDAKGRELGWHHIRDLQGVRPPRGVIEDESGSIVGSAT